MPFRKYTLLNPVQQSIYNPIKLYEFICESYNSEAIDYSLYVLFLLYFHIDGILQKC